MLVSLGNEEPGPNSGSASEGQRWLDPEQTALLALPFHLKYRWMTLSSRHCGQTGPGTGVYGLWQQDWAKACPHSLWDRQVLIWVLGTGGWGGVIPEGLAWTCLPATSGLWELTYHPHTPHALPPLALSGWFPPLGRPLPSPPV